MIVFILQATYFVAFLTMEIRRIRAHRNAFLPCISMDDSKPVKSITSGETAAKKLKHSNPGKLVFKKFATFLMYPTSKAMVVVLTCCLTAIGAFGVT